VVAMTPERREHLRAAKSVWRRRHPQKHTAAMRRYRQAKRYERRLAVIGVTEADLQPWLEQMGRSKPSPWRARARDLWDAWQLVCEQQQRWCFVCKTGESLESACYKSTGEMVGAVCGKCARVFGRKATT
jgi:hypothetical protein